MQPLLEQDLPSLILSNRQLKAELTRLEFLPTARNGLAAPSRLYDPRNSALRTLLDPDKHFPVHPYNTDEVCPSAPHIVLCNIAE